jgi:hypothetical protein
MGWLMIGRAGKKDADLVYVGTARSVEICQAANHYTLGNIRLLSHYMLGVRGGIQANSCVERGYATFRQKPPTNPSPIMKVQESSVHSKFTIHSGLATALGIAVAATQAEAALVSLTPGTQATNAIANFEISATGVLVLNHSQFSTTGTIGGTMGDGSYAGNNSRHNFVITSWSGPSSNIPVWGTWSSPGTPHSSSSRSGRVAGASGVNLASARRGAGLFTVDALMFTGSGVNVAKGTQSGGPIGTTGSAMSGADNYIPVKFNLGGGDLYGIAKVDFNEVGTGYVKLLDFWYSDNGSELKFDSGTVSEVSAIPEVGGMVSTALLLGMAALVRSRRKDPQAGSLAALAAGVGGLMARANSSEEAA